MNNKPVLFRRKKKQFIFYMFPDIHEELKAALFANGETLTDWVEQVAKERLARSQDNTK